MNELKIAVLSGDGIGPEVMAEAERVLAYLLDSEGIRYETRYADVGGIAIDRQGSALPEATLEICRWSQAILFGSVGGPQWENLAPDLQPERASLLPLRKIFGLYANLRPAVIFPGLQDASPLKNEIIGEGFNMLVVRELTGGIYFGQPKGREGSRAFDTLVYSEGEIRRIAHVAFRAAQGRRRKVCSVDKANVLSSMLLWREVVSAVGEEYPNIELSHLYVDNAAMQIIRDPQQFDVLLCGNMFGDIMSDEASMITGSIGMNPSASLGLSVGDVQAEPSSASTTSSSASPNPASSASTSPSSSANPNPADSRPTASTNGAATPSANRQFGLYEPVGGSAPDIAGKGIANPIAQILSLAMMLQYSFGLSYLSQRIHKAVESVLAQGFRCADIMSPECTELSTSEMSSEILKSLQNIK